MSRRIWLPKSREESKLWLHQLWHFRLGFPGTFPSHDAGLLGKTVSPGAIFYFWFFIYQHPVVTTFNLKVQFSSYRFSVFTSGSKRSNALQLKETPTNRKTSPKLTKNNRSWIKHNRNRKTTQTLTKNRLLENTTEAFLGTEQLWKWRANAEMYEQTCI